MRYIHCVKVHCSELRVCLLSYNVELMCAKCSSNPSVYSKIRSQRNNLQSLPFCCMNSLASDIIIIVNWVWTLLHAWHILSSKHRTCIKHFTLDLQASHTMLARNTWSLVLLVTNLTKTKLQETNLRTGLVEQ